MLSVMKTHPILRIFRGALVYLPTPTSISTFWNFGSLLGLCLTVQIVTGLFLAIHYSRDIIVAFNSVNHIYRDVNFGWLLRILHANGASFFFICLYLHVGRGLYFGSFSFQETWAIGVVILLVIMATAFLGYVLPWGQISFWGATVITNLFSAIPIVGHEIVYWLWGGFAVDNPTLTRFFALHFILPFIISALVGVHLLFLHQTGSNNPLGLSMNKDKSPFHPYFTIKDLVGILVIIIAFCYIVFLEPWTLGDPENFIPANPLVTPVHIQPEWYFLFAYAILRSIPNKLGGVVALAGAVLILIIIPFMPRKKFQSSRFYSPLKSYFWAFIVCIILLTWIGARPVEEPYIFSGQVLTLFYFGYYFFNWCVIWLWDSTLSH